MFNINIGRGKKNHTFYMVVDCELASQISSTAFSNIMHAWFNAHFTDAKIGLSSNDLDRTKWAKISTLHHPVSSDSPSILKFSYTTVLPLAPKDVQSFNYWIADLYAESSHPITLPNGDEYEFECQVIDEKTAKAVAARAAKAAKAAKAAAAKEAKAAAKAAAAKSFMRKTNTRA
jgi:hypothetical protein